MSHFRRTEPWLHGVTGPQPCPWQREMPSPHKKKKTPAKQPDRLTCCFVIDIMGRLAFPAWLWVCVNLRVVLLYTPLTRLKKGSYRRPMTSVPGSPCGGRACANSCHKGAVEPPCFTVLTQHTHTQMRRMQKPQAREAGPVGRAGAAAALVQR